MGYLMTFLFSLGVLGVVFFLPQILFSLEMWAVRRSLEEEDNA